MFSFLSGTLCGAVVGAVTVLLLTPASGEELRMEAQNRWAEMRMEAQRAKAETQARLEQQYEQLSR